MILTALVWAAVFQADLIFFSFHPLLNSLALLLLVQGVLVLQPTALQKDKINGTYTHAVFNGLAVAGKTNWTSFLLYLIGAKGFCCCSPHRRSGHHRNEQGLTSRDAVPKRPWQDGLGRLYTHFLAMARWVYVVLCA